MKPTDPNHSWLRDRYTELANVGIALNPFYTFEDLAEIFNHHGLHGMPGLLAALGDAHGRFPHFHLSDNIWLFDAECVEDPPVYADIAYRINAITAPILSLSNVKSDLNYDEETAWLEFECRGVHYHWDLTIDEDWVDPKVFDLFCHLLEKLEPYKAIAASPDGQCSFFIFTDPFRLEQIRKVTGLEWDWLETEPITEGS